MTPIPGVSVEFIGFEEEDGVTWLPEPSLKTGPEVPPPVWDERAISGEAAIAAVRAMCA